MLGGSAFATAKAFALTSFLDGIAAARTLLSNRDVGWFSRFVALFSSPFSSKRGAPEVHRAVDVVLEEEELFEVPLESGRRLRIGGVSTRAFAPSEELLDAMRTGTDDDEGTLPESEPARPRGRPDMNSWEAKINEDGTVTVWRWLHGVLMRVFECADKSWGASLESGLGPHTHITLPGRYDECPRAQDAAVKAVLSWYGRRKSAPTKEIPARIGRKAKRAA